MKTWRWLYHPTPPFTRGFVGRVLLKAAVIVLAVNVLFVAANPVPTLGRFSAYNVLFPGRERLPYGENPAAAYNLSLYSVEAMFASHTLSRPKPADEFRVLVLGDSSVWGILLRPEETLVGQLNAQDLRMSDGRRVRFYNLGYPTMSLLKDLLLLDEAMRYDPDLIVWLVTLESFEQGGQLDSAILQHNPERVRTLIAHYGLAQDPADPRLVTLSTWEKTLVGRRRDLADLLRLQYYGVLWAVTGIDQEYRDDYTPRAVDLPADESWRGFRPGALSADDLAFDVLSAGVARAGDVRVVLINEPMLLSDGENSDIRYNAFYPRWAYDVYREWLSAHAQAEGWALLDFWDALPEAECYTDSAVHLTPKCSARLAARVGAALFGG